ncbi:MAG: mshA 5 [Acidobacteria bacterium]|nr:mshA 5 [Acidobacteriota bacterium]
MTELPAARIGIDARKIADFGIGTYIRGLLGGLNELRGPEQYVVFGPPSAAPLIPPAFEHVVVDAPHYSLRELFVLGGAIRRAGLDLFHAPHYVLPVTSCRTAVTIHDLIHLHVPHGNPLKPLYARAMLRRAVRKAAVVLTVSEAVKGELVAELGADPKRVVVTPNGCDARFTPGASASRRTPYFLYVGNDKPHKNVGTLVRAVEQLAASGVELVLAGARFEAWAGRPGVIHPGFVAEGELTALYRGALALVMPSDEEGFGLPALEAMSCGTPVIVSRARALVEVTGPAALHVDGRSANELAAAMRRVMESEELRAAMGAAGIERARAFTWQRCAAATRSAYALALR